MIKNRANVEAKTVKGRVPLCVACIENKPKIVLALINIGVNINAMDYSDWTALHHASYSGYTNIVKILIEAGADRTIRNMDGQQTALDVAYKNKNEVQNLFKQYGDRTVEPSTTLGGIKTYQVESVNADLVHSTKGSLIGR